MSNSTTEDSVAVPLLSPLRRATNSTSQVAIVGSDVCPIESLDYEYEKNSYSCFAFSILLLLSLDFVVYAFDLGSRRMISSSRIGEVVVRLRFSNTCL